MRYLAIDYGTRRVGLAVSDEGGQFVSPLAVVEVTTPRQAIEAVVAAVKGEGVDRLVVGLPINMDGTEGHAATTVRTWAKDLAVACGITVLLVDERLSSFDAEQQLIQRKRDGEKMTRRGKKRRLDAHAAASFLRGFLEGSLPMLGQIDPPSPEQVAQPTPPDGA